MLHPSGDPQCLPAGRHDRCAPPANGTQTGQLTPEIETGGSGGAHAPARKTGGGRAGSRIERIEYVRDRRKIGAPLDAVQDASFLGPRRADHLQTPHAQRDVRALVNPARTDTAPAMATRTESEIEIEGKRLRSEERRVRKEWR